MTMNTKSDNIQKYIGMIEHEIGKLADRFTGNIVFQFNFKEGSVANSNIEKKTSIKLNDR